MCMLFRNTVFGVCAHANSPCVVQGLSFIIALRTEAPLHRKPSFTETFHESCGAWKNEEGHRTFSFTISDKVLGLLKVLKE